MLLTLFGGAHFLELYGSGAIEHSVRHGLHLKAEDATFLLSVYSLCYGVVQIPLGLAFSRIHPIRLLRLGGWCFALGNILFAMSPSFAWALAARFVTGFGAAVFFPGFIAIAGRYFEPRYFANLIGLNNAFKSLMALAFVALAPALLSSLGWRGYFYAQGSAIFLMTIPLSFVKVEPRRQPRSRNVIQNLKNLGKEFYFVVRQRNVLCAIPIGLFANGGIMAFTGFWYVPFSESLGYSDEKAAWIVSLSMLSTLIGYLFSGSISSWFKSRKYPVAVSLCAVLATLLILMFWTTSPLACEIALVLVLSFSYAIYASLVTVILKESLSIELSTVATGIWITSVYLGSFLMQFIPGALFNFVSGGARHFHNTPTLDFQWALIVFPLVLFGSAIAGFLMKETFPAKPQSSEAGVPAP